MRASLLAVTFILAASCGRTDAPEGVAEAFTAADAIADAPVAKDAQSPKDALPPKDTLPPKDVAPPPSGPQYPIQVILNIHNHSPASFQKEDVTKTNDKELHCLVRRFVKAADGWLRLADSKVPGMDGIRFSLMLDGHFTAWNTWHLANQVAGGDACTPPLDLDYESSFIDDLDASGALSANAGLDLPKFVAAGHEVGHHTHCHEIDESVASNPDHLYWMNRDKTAFPAEDCYDSIAQGNKVIQQVDDEIVKALTGTGHVPHSLHQSMGDVAWRKSHGYDMFDGGFDALLLRNVGHVLWNPYRPCCAFTGDMSARCSVKDGDMAYPVLREAGSDTGCDRDVAKFLAIPELAQAGAFGAHPSKPTMDQHLFSERKNEMGFRYGSNNSLSHMKKTFWLLYHERRLWQQKGLPPRVWTIGWATHDSRNDTDKLRYDAGWDEKKKKYHDYDVATETVGEGTLPQFYGWVAANFVAKTGASSDGGTTAEFATFADVKTRFEEWESKAPGSSAVGQSGFGGPTAPYPYELKFNRLLGPGNVELTNAGPGRLVFDVHDTMGYDMSKCIEDVPYEYDKITGNATLRTDCDTLGAVEGRYVQLWSETATTVDVRTACGSFSTCADPWVPVLDAATDDVSKATMALASAVPVGPSPSLVVCAEACCASMAPCKDSGWK